MPTYTEALKYGTYWGTIGTPVTLKYNFLTALPSYYDPNYGIPGTFKAFNAAQKAAAIKAMTLISQFTNASFAENSDPNQAEITWGNIDSGNSSVQSAFAYYPDNFGYGGDVWFENYWLDYAPDPFNAPTEGKYSDLVYMHELGHAMGLVHGDHLTNGQDSRQYTVMSYTLHPYAINGAEPKSYMLYDIATLQELYGADYTFNAGNDTYTYSFLSDIRAIWDGGGIDTFDASADTSGVNISLVDGTFSTIGKVSAYQDNLAIAYNTIIENANGGSADDLIFGNKVANILNGNGGADSLYGEGGDDTLNGGAGADYLSGGANDDTLIGGADSDSLDGGTGTDTVDYSTSATAVLVNTSTASQKLGSITVAAGSVYEAQGSVDSLISIEKVIGSKYADIFFGGTGSDVFTGGKGNDTFTGGAGSDTIDGGSNTDTVVYTSSTASVLINLGATTQTLNGTSVAAGTARDGLGGIDRLTSIENINGSNKGDWMVGSTAANVFMGGAGNDTMVGGAGNDTLNGGSGTDTIDYSSSTAAIIINLGTASQTFNKVVVAGGTGIDGLGGTDTIVSVEIVLASKFNDVVYGSDAGNKLSGGAGNDNLYGSVGKDTLIGGEGNDLLDGGSDYDLVDYSSSTSAVIVNLGTTSQTVGKTVVVAGTAVDGLGGIDKLVAIEKITGTSKSDWIMGNSSKNTLSGGAGNDTLNGWSNNDSLSGGDGNDTLKGGTGNDSLSGGDGNDLLYGESGIDLIYGDAGQDTLSGGTEADTFKFQVSTLDGKIDTITDFSIAQKDVIDISDLLVGYDPLTKLITNYVNMTTVSGDTVVKIDRDGTGSAYKWAQIAVIDNVTGMTDEASLLKKGTLIAA